MRTESELPVLATDVTFVRVNSGRAYGDVVNCDEDADPVIGQHVLLADGGTERVEAVITELRPEGVIALAVPAFAAPLRVAG